LATIPEVYSALERGRGDCAVTVRATGNWLALVRVTTPYTLRFRGIAAYGWNLLGDKLDPPCAISWAKYITSAGSAMDALGLELTEDGVACNAGQAAGCTIVRVVALSLLR